MGRHSDGPNRDHYAGACWCGLNHTVPGAKYATEQDVEPEEATPEEPQYDNIIGRSDTGPDPLVQEP
jgi:hypothetical protein